MQYPHLQYVLGLCIIAGFLALCIWLYLRSRRAARYEPFNYAGIDKNVRIYYELISDAIQQMRMHEGDSAMELANSIPGLVLDPASGKIVRIDGDPSAIMAALIAAYRERFGRNVNLAFSSNEEMRAIVR